MGEVPTHLKTSAHPDWLASRPCPASWAARPQAGGFRVLEAGARGGLLSGGAWSLLPGSASGSRAETAQSVLTGWQKAVWASGTMSRARMLRACWPCCSSWGLRLVERFWAQ